MKETNLSQLLDISHPGTLFELLGHYRVVVPAIQRHYVQGANTPKANEVRVGFLNDLFTHFKEKPDKPFKLDYIFGPIRTDGDDSFVPVDGQQRLTTLWLLARYAAEKLSTEDQRIGILRLLERFSYEGRLYARRFCDALTRNDSPRWWEDAKQAVEKPSLALRRKGLLNPGWMTDATVAAMSRMLDAIHGFWNDDIDTETFLVFLWNQVRFELCYDQFADDIYMKMNARGLELTQWENFKGVFASKINDDPRKQFNEEIEKLSNLFYDKFKEESDEWKKLPDQAFFALFARLADYVLRTSMTADQPFKDEQHNNLFVLAESKVAVNQTYVPIEEFGLDDGVAEKIALPVLRIIHWSLENDAPFTYWDETKKIVDAVFFPQNANERDFSLFLYEYFSKYDDGEALKSNDFRALRLVANILENVARQPRDITSTKQFNRIEILRQFLQESAGLYASNVALHRNAPLQCVEEKVKAALYETIDSPDIVKLIPMLHACEKALHGRVRIAILNLSNKDSEECIPDIKNNLECLRQRLTKVQMLCKEWTTGNDDQRAELFFDKIVPAFDWDIPNDVRLVFKDDKADHGLRGIICTENDACLQRTLIDGEVSKGVEGADYDIDGVRDWRDILCKKDLRQIFSVDGIKVKWHYASGRYYLYTGENQVRWAYPISDYRIDVLFDDEFEKVLRQISLNSSEEERKELIRLNNGSTVSFCMKNGLICYFGRNDITVRAYGEKGSHLQNVSWSYKEFHGTISSFLLGISEMTFDDFVANGKNALRFSK